MAAYPVFVSYCTTAHPHHYMLLKTWLKCEHTDYSISGTCHAPEAVLQNVQQPLLDWLYGQMSEAKLCIILVGKGKSSPILEDEKVVAQYLNIPCMVVDTDIWNQGKEDSQYYGLSDQLALHIPFRHKVVTHALKYWPTEYLQYKQQGMNKPHFYSPLITNFI